MPPGPPSRLRSWDRAELALFVTLPATVFAFAAGSSSLLGLARVALTFRWAMLVALAAVAVWFGWSSRNRLPRSLVAAVGGLGAIGLLSATWSVSPRITAERALAFLAVVTVAAFIGAGAARSRHRVEVVLAGLLIGPVLVALAGLVVLAVAHSHAIQPGGPGLPSRLRGFGGNPNTDAMLFALGLPVAVWALVASHSTRLRIGAAAAAALLYGSVLASGSRGAMLACAGGAMVFVLIRVRPLRVLVPVVAVMAALFAAGFSVAGSRPAPGADTQQAARMAQPAPATTTVAPPEAEQGPAKGAGQVPARPAETPAPGAPGAKPTPTIGSLGGRFTIELAPTVPANRVPLPFPPETDEIGYPGIYQYKPILAYGSGRFFIWLTAIRQGLDRPALGYGFGTEQYVFADRSYIFLGAFTENSFVGIFLELGIVGVLLLVFPFAAVAALAVRALRRARAVDRGVIAVGAATTVAGLVIAFFQSYLYSVGNVATLTFWVILFLAVAVSGRRAASRGADPAL